MALPGVLPVLFMRLPASKVVRRSGRGLDVHVCVCARPAVRDTPQGFWEAPLCAPERMSVKRHVVWKQF